ncbi:MAG: YHS domain-containing protein [Alphaproteobacteria bacterium]|nr:MAG: YHS domain-containing protein [Alphaproteobacteria bacterium]
MKHLVAAFILFVSGLAGSGAALAGEDPVYTGLFNDHAVGGYDTVAYFTDAKALKGKKQFSSKYMGAEWRFATQANLDAFLADPARYAPQYGGYCAWAVARGYTASGDPEQWKIVDGKLYLNYNAEVKATWEQDIPGYIAKADVNYPTLVDLESEGN